MYDNNYSMLSSEPDWVFAHVLIVLPVLFCDCWIVLHLFYFGLPWFIVIVNRENTTNGDSPEKFDPETEPILAYLERIEIYFAANEIKEEKKVPVFLNAIGKQTYGVII